MIWLALPAIAASAYWVLALVAAIGWRRTKPQAARGLPPVSILKPLHGRDPHLYEALRSHAAQDYPEFEILFGSAKSSDPALAEAERLRAEFPNLPIRTFEVPTKAPNAKAGVLAVLASQARHPVLVIDDSDITVEPDYLRTVAAMLEDARIGVVTSLYRASAESFATRLEALGIATEFAPSVLVARLLNSVDFALGSTMAVRAEMLRKIGGFEDISNYLADDYQLGRRVTKLGFRTEFAPMAVETHLGAASCGDVWRHQLRWSRTIRVSRPAGYYGYAVTHATLWALVALAAGAWPVAAAAMSLRLAAAWLVGARVLRDGKVARNLWLVPVRDMLGFAVWMGGIFGKRIAWRDRSFRLLPDGRIVP